MTDNTNFLSTQEAARILKEGGLVGLPTETVYGLAADATQPEAVKGIFAAKGRPADHPLIVHIDDIAKIGYWAKDIPADFVKLAEAFWPGPFTVVLNKTEQVSDTVTGAQPTVAIRIPDSQEALETINLLGTGVAAPSANRFGRVSPTQAKHVLEELGDRIDGVVDGGTCQVGIESTILDLTGDTPRLLRPGHISQQEIEQCLGYEISTKSEDAPRVSGQLKAHYAPMTPLMLVEENELQSKTQELLDKGHTINIWSQNKILCEHSQVLWHPMPKKAETLAYELYHQLRAFDEPKADITLIQRPPSSSTWQAVLDRLSRAQAHFE